MHPLINTILVTYAGNYSFECRTHQTPEGRRAKMAYHVPVPIYSHSGLRS